MLFIAYVKSFEDKAQFENHFAYKLNHIRLNSLKLFRDISITKHI